MATIRISPAAVRAAGLAFVAGGDDVGDQAAALRAVSMPAMPPAMAAAHEASLAAAADRLAQASMECGQIGQELQVRAAAAELADSPTESRDLAAALQVRQSVVTTSVVGAGNVVTTATITIARSGAATAVTGSGMQLTLGSVIDPDAARGVGTQPPGQASDPARTGVPERAANPIEPHREIGGRPAAAVSHALGVGGGGGGFGSGPLPAAHGAADLLHGDTIDPASIPEGEQRAEHHDGTGAPAPTDMPHGADADRQDWACWMASVAAKEGLPPVLPVMMALAASGLRNVPEVEGRVGMFGLDTGRAYAPPGAGMPMDSRPPADWWEDHPQAQLDRVLSDLQMHGGGIRDAGLDDQDGLARWAGTASVDMDPAALGQAHQAATDLVGACRHDGGAATSAPSHRGALDVARRELARGVHEFGTNAGPEVDRYLAAAKVGSGNPWCASFVTWSMQQSGHEMPGTGWAAVSTWVHAAEQGQHGLHLVDAASARPGDIVAYDWGGDGDFAADGHIGFLDSKVEHGAFTAVEGNAEDAVSRMERNIGMGKVVFIRAGA